MPQTCTTVAHNHPYISSLKPQIASFCSYICGDGYVWRYSTCLWHMGHDNPFLVCLLPPPPSLHPSDFLGFCFTCLCPFLAVLQIILHVFIVSLNSNFFFSSLFQSSPIFLCKILSILIYLSSNLFVFVPSSSFFWYLPPCQYYSTLPPSTLLSHAPSLYLLINLLFS